MKRFGNLYYRICDIDNLYLAYTKARKGKGNTYGVIQFEKGLDDNINALHKELSEDKYVTSEYQLLSYMILRNVKYTGSLSVIVLFIMR